MPKPKELCRCGHARADHLEGRGLCKDDPICPCVMFRASRKPEPPTESLPQTQMEPTPRPKWGLNTAQLIQIVPGVDTVEIWAHDEPNWIAQVATKQHAEKIIRAVNSFDDLLEALKQISQNHYDPTMRNVALDAISKAEGRS